MEEEKSDGLWHHACAREAGHRCKAQGSIKGLVVASGKERRPEAEIKAESRQNGYILLATHD
jgi:hypothetical protein